MQPHTRLIHLLVLLSLLFGQIGAWPARAQEVGPAQPDAADGPTVLPPAFDPALDAAPAEADALVTDPHNPQWTVRYGSELGRRTIAAASAPANLVPEGPTIPVGGWAANLTLEAGTKDIMAVAALPDGRIWAGVKNDGLRIYSPAADGVYGWTTLKAAAGGLISNRVTSLAYFGGEVWVGTDDAGISVYTPATNAWRRAHTGNSNLPSNGIRRLTAVDVPNSAADTLWASTNAGAARWTAGGAAWTVLTTAQGLPSNDIFDVGVQFFGAQVFTYIATTSGVVRWNGATITPITGGGACTMDRATRVWVESNFTTWFAAEQNVPAQNASAIEGHAPDAVWVPIGLCRATITLGTFWSHFNAGFGLPSNDVSDMSQDGSGRVWFGFRAAGGASKGGLAAHDQGNWLILTKPTSPLVNESVSRVLAVGEDVWAGFANATAFSIYSPNWDSVLPIEMGASAAPRALYLEQNKLWVALGKVVSWYDGAQWHAQASPSAHDFTALVRGPDSLMWLSTAGSGVFSYDGANTFVKETIANGLPSNNVRALTTDPGGRMWAATAGGLAMRGSSYWVGFTAANSGLASNNVTSVTADGSSRIWAGTAANGISVYDPTAATPWSQHTTATGLPANAINDLTTDPAGHIWAATDAGVARWDGSSWTTYTTAQGLPSDTILSIASDPAGLIWAGTTAGLALRDATGWQTFHVTGSFLGADRVGDMGADGVRTWVAAGNQMAIRGIVTGPIGSAPPTIASFAPVAAEPLAPITLTGTNFDTRGPEYNEVRFCCVNGQSGTPAPIAKVLSVTSTQLVVEVPLLAKSGKMEVTVHGLTRSSATDLQIIPVITSIPGGCQVAGEQLTILGRGFFGVGNAGAYVKIGNGPERLADYQEPGKIIQYIRPGDTAGKVRVRLVNNRSDLSASNVAVVELQVSDFSIQQAINTQQMIWGKRTLVQLYLKHNGPNNCKVTVKKGHIHWKKKDGTTVLASSIGYFPQPEGIKISNSTYPVGEWLLGNSINFVAEFNTPRSGYSDIFPLSSFDGMRVTLGETWATALTVNVPEFFFNYTHISDQRHFLNVPIVPDSFTSAQWDTYRANLSEGMKHVARVYPQQDTYIGPYERNWIHNYGGSAMEVPWPVYLDDDDVYEDDWDDLRDDVDDLREAFNDLTCDGHPCYPYFDQAMGIVAEELYAEGPGGKAISGCWGSTDECDRWSGISFILSNNLAATWLQEAIHATEWVAEGAVNHDSANAAHSKYDEGEPANPANMNCDDDLTFRQAVIDQMGALRRVVRLDDGAPYAFPMTACGTYLNMPNAALSYGPNWTDDNTFIEPVDQTHVVSYIASNGLQAQGHRLAEADRTLRFNGDIDASDRVTVTMSAILGNEGATITPSGGPYHLLLRGANNAILFDQAFGVGGPHTHESGEQHFEGGRFNLRIPFPDGTAKAEVRHGTTLLWSKTVSAHAPTVAFTTPNGGSYNAANAIPVAWTANDQDGDPLQFNLDYTPDNGATWIPVAQKLTGNSFTWNPNFVPPSAAARLRLRASDGFNTGYATSAPFVLTARPPVALISNPQEGQTFTEGARLDLEGGSFTGAGEDLGSFEWKCGGAIIGADRGISYTLDQVGSRTFELKVTADGQSDTTSVTIQVLPDLDRDGMPNDWELAYQLNPLNAADAVDDPDNDGLTNADEYRLGTNPRQPDTDSDGAKDGAEVNAHTDPLNPAKKPATGPVLMTGADLLGFTVQVGDPVSDQQAFWITNGGPGSLNWTATSDAAWLQVSPTSGAAPTKMTVSALPGGKAPGEYTGHITVQAAGAAGSPDVITVTLTIEPATHTQKVYLPSITR